ncbi:MAG: RHS repeat domain-containing protein [Flammeovirgaceae bacterium]
MHLLPIYPNCLFTSQFLFILPPNQVTSGQLQAYARMVIVDEDGNELQEQFELISHAANRYNSLTLQLAIEHDGYAIVYLANESMMDVFFDELRVKHERLVWQENSYYPFGMSIKPLDKDGQPDHRFTYNGKEYQEEIGWSDYGARMLDAQIARWNGVDLLAEEYLPISPYAYVANNPIKLVDPDGMQIVGVNEQSGSRVRDAIHKTFEGDKFEKLRKLITLEKDGKTFASIDENAFASAIGELSDDEQALANAYFQAINASEVHTIEAVYRGEDLAVGTPDFKTGQDVDTKAGGGANYQTANGSHSIIVMDSKAKINYHSNANLDKLGPQAYKSSSSPGELIAHELLGHGYGNSINPSQAAHEFAIQMSNLHSRVTGSSLFRDGQSHSTPPNAPQHLKRFVSTKLSQSTATAVPNHFKLSERMKKKSRLLTPMKLPTQY